MGPPCYPHEQSNLDSANSLLNLNFSFNSYFSLQKWVTTLLPHARTRLGRGGNGPPMPRNNHRNLKARQHHSTPIGGGLAWRFLLFSSNFHPFPFSYFLYSPSFVYFFFDDVTSTPYSFPLLLFFLLFLPNPVGPLFLIFNILPLSLGSPPLMNIRGSGPLLCFLHFY